VTFPRFYFLPIARKWRINVEALPISILTVHEDEA